MDFHSKRHFFGATRFFRIDNGHYQGVFCMICSQNNTLTELYLSYNQIGDAGAASIGGALAYVTLSSCEWTFLQKDISLAPPDFFGLIRALSRFVCVRFAAKTTRWRHCTSTETKLAMLALSRSVAPWRTSLFDLVFELSFKKTFLWRHPNLSNW